MKKIISLSVALLMIFLCGCTVLDEQTSSIYDDTAAVDSLLAQIESDIRQREANGEITVSVFEQEYVTDGDDDTVVKQPGKQNAVVDSDTQNVTIDTIAPSKIDVSGTNPLYYEFLTEKQKEIYCYMKTAADQMKTGYFSIGASSGEQNRFTDIAISYRALLCDNPQIFWLSGTYMSSPDGSALAFSYAEKGLDYIMTPQQKNTAQAQLDAAINDLVSRANTLSNNFEKELFFHDWLCKSITYTDRGEYSDYTIYGALIEKKAVCEGYSRAMQILCNKANIPCTVVYGSSFGEGHMWNIANPGDGWYHIDVTWDDDEDYNYIRHAYFNVNDNEILKDHSIFEQVVPGKYYLSGDEFNIHKYTCELTTQNYFIKKKLIFTSDHSVNAKLIKEADRKGKSSLEVYYWSDDYVEFLNALNTTIANSGSDIWIKDFSYLGGSLVVCW